MKITVCFISARFLLVTGILLALTGCTTPKATIDSYLDPGYARGTITKLAIFPIRNAELSPAESQQVNREIAMGIARKDSSIVIVGPTEAVRLLNEHDLANTWARFLDTYASTGIPDANTLSQVGEALGVDAILQGEVLDVLQRDGEYGSHSGETRITLRFSMLSVNQGAMVWQASSEGRAKTLTTIERAPPLIEAIRASVDRIITSLPL